MALLAGILLIVMGGVAMTFSALASFVTISLLGIALAVGGIILGSQSFQRYRVLPRIAQFLSALMMFVVGMVFIFRPLTGLRSVTPFLLGLFFIDGVFLMVSALSRRHELWGLRFAVGLATVVLGVILSASARRENVFLAGLLIGVVLIIRGIEIVAGSFRMRRRLKQLRDREPGITLG